MTAARLTGIDPTGSSLDRIARCTPSAALPQVFDAHDQVDRDRGTALHAFLDSVAKLKKAGVEDPRATALEEADEQWRDVCAEVELAKLADTLEMSTEVAVAYDWRADTARILRPVEPRVYEIDPESEVAGTLDVMGVGDRVVYVGDFKGPYGWLPEPHQSMQLGLGAVAAARLTGARSARLEYIRLRSDGTPGRFNATLDVFGLEAAAERIQRTMAAVDEMRPALAAGVVPNVTEGPWCRRCPAAQHCPAKTALVRSVLHDPPALSLREPLTPETAGNAYVMIRKAKSAIAMAEAAMYAYAKTTPIPLGVDEDGSLRFFGEHRRPGNDVVDGAVAHRVLTARYGGEAANQAVTMKATKAAISDVARKHLQEGDKITKVVKSIVDEIRQAGGIDNPETCTTTEYTVAPDGAAKVRKRKAS